MLVTLGVGSFVLLDMKPWTARKFQDARPAPSIKILGRDDPATLEAQRAEREEERRRRTRPAASTSAAVSSASAPATSAPMTSASAPTTSASASSAPR